MSKIICVNRFSKLDSSFFSLDVTSRVKSPFSPFLLRTEKGILENVWQYSKVYSEHLDSNGNIKDEWYKWRDEGYGLYRAVRHPMGKGIKEEFSFWNGERLTKVDARKQIYIPLYKESVSTTKKDAFSKIVDCYEDLSNQDKDLYLRDFDGYDRHSVNMSLEDVINNTNKSLGHCFVLEMMILEHMN